MNNTMKFFCLSPPHSDTLTLSLSLSQTLCRGNEKRSQAATAANEVSSRSHDVLQVGRNRDREKKNRK